MKNYTQWDVNDLAFLIYADYKGASRGEVGQIFGVSGASVSQQMSKIKNPETYSKKIQDMVNKAGVLEMKVRSGMYPDHRKMWDDKLTKITGVAYTYPETPAELTSDPSDEEEVVEQHPPLLQLTISTEAVLTIIKAWRGINDK